MARRRCRCDFFFYFFVFSNSQKSFFYRLLSLFFFLLRLTSPRFLSLFWCHQLWQAPPAAAAGAAVQPPPRPSPADFFASFRAVNIHHRCAARVFSLLNLPTNTTFSNLVVVITIIPAVVIAIISITVATRVFSPSHRRQGGLHRRRQLHPSPSSCRTFC